MTGFSGASPAERFPPLRSQPDQRRTRFRLPGWAAPDHPIVERELSHLPRLVQRPGHDLRSILTLLLMLLFPCVLLTGSLPLHLVLLPLSWLPLLFAAPAISRERAAGTWDTLRLTPFSPGELALAKACAVAHHLRPLLMLLLAGQVASFLTAGLFLCSFLGAGGHRTLAGTYTRMAAITPEGLPATLAAGLIVVVVALVAVPLDYALSILTGMLASLLATRQEAALAAGLALRTLAAGLILLAGMGVFSAQAGVLIDPLSLLGAGMVGGVFGWPLAGLLDWQGAAALAALVMLGLQALLVLLMAGAVVRQADRV